MQVKIDALRLWPTAESRGEFFSTLRRALGDNLDETSADELLDLTRGLFDESDALRAWPDMALWGLLSEALERVDWLDQLLSGHAPHGFPMPPSATERSHIRHPVRRAAMLLDKPGRTPLRSIERLPALLACEANSGSCSNRHTDALDEIRNLLRRARDEIEPLPGPAISSKREQIRDLWIAAGITPISISYTALYTAARGFLQGRRLDPPPLVAVVKAIGRLWESARGKLPPIAREPSSGAALLFSDVLRSLEAAHCRNRGELGQSIVRKAITQLRKERKMASAG